MQVADIISLVANVGFPVTLCFILIKYVLQNVNDKLNNMNNVLQVLSQEIKSLDEKVHEVKAVEQADSKKG
ncbi:hypothetical protein RE628_05645 [Paenibacillus sp. D2_2]|uniref:hypothetical protein n=1 Tax=Paenibacillus sp. D2_2 TaxID=3073092 RepID=UPI002815D486|nr:hypothetical protein [Paenibacillus sp. D2_2]WMT41926.1 hypothetical protein RE628_05645 [Paenibacillus sp. D2_2]